jgi:hypothetical protein
MKAKKCRLILHGSFRQFDMGIFNSITAAKKYVRDCWDRPYTILVNKMSKREVYDT